MNKETRITIIGIQDKKLDKFPEELTEKQIQNSCFAGGARHYQLVKHLLPPQYHWETISIPLQGLFNKIKEKNGDWIIFASGDPLFYGIGNTIKSQLPMAFMQVIPTFNAIQLLAHKAGISYGEYKTVSLTGRPWNAFDAALINNTTKISVLTDKKKTPGAIAQRMYDYGYTNYKMTVGECLGAEHEKIHQLSIEDAAQTSFHTPNCLFLVQSSPGRRLSGIEDRKFKKIPNRPKLITKMPVRITTLSLMEIINKKCLWDIGACTGSISIEAKLQNPMLNTEAFEIRKEAAGIIEANTRQFGTPGIHIHTGDFINMDKSRLELPDAIFIGGYGGKMEAVLNEADQYLVKKGIIAFNAVKEESLKTFYAWIQKMKYQVEFHQTIKTDNHNAITIIVAQKTQNQ